MRRGIRGALFVAAFAAIAAVNFRTIAEESRPVGAFAISVSATPFTDFEPQSPEKRDFGPFLFKTGAYLQSTDPNFGGLSGMQFLDQGKRLLAVSDAGFWLDITIGRDRDGMITGLTAARMAPIYSGLGPRLKTPKYYVDAESLVRDGDDLYAAFEEINVIARYRLDLATLVMEPEMLPLPESVSQVGDNKGIEALALVPPGQPLAGSLLAIAERGASRAEPTPGWILSPKGGAGKTVETGTFKVKQSDGFDVTEAVILGNGDLLLLERRFTVATGVAIRLRRIKASDITNGALLDGPVLFQAGLAHRIDNMEAMALYQNDQGETVVALLADDNYSLLQRTVYLEFVLPNG